MGACASADAVTDRVAKEQSRTIEDQLAASNKASSVIHKLLLLGAGESGKSTLFKQVLTIYGKGISEDERRTYTSVIRTNTIQSMKTLVERFPAFAAKDPRCALTLPTSIKAKEALDGVSADDRLTGNVAAAISALWEDPSIKATFEHKSQMQIPDSAGYFFDRVSDLAKDNYLPSHQDVLRVRVRTTGIVESDFVISGNHFKICDVGGQRNERKKWIHCFEGVTAVLFVVAASEYDQVLYEDESTNRMVEALNLFDEIVNSKYFRDTSIILFLNKRDLFQEKLRSIPLKSCFPEYTGPAEDPVTALGFLQAQFESRNRHDDKHIFTHYTTATDQENVDRVFSAVREIVVRKSLEEAGLA